jgi:hypothetical protein
LPPYNQIFPLAVRSEESILAWGIILITGFRSQNTLLTYISAVVSGFSPTSFSYFFVSCRKKLDYRSFCVSESGALKSESIRSDLLENVVAVSRWRRAFSVWIDGKLSISSLVLSKDRVESRENDLNVYARCLGGVILVVLDTNYVLIFA